MKWLFCLVLFSTSVLAQDPCGGKPDLCQKVIQDAVFFKDHDSIKKIINKYGVKTLFLDQKRGGPYKAVNMGAFFENIEFFKIISKHPTYPSEIPDKNLFLRNVVDSSQFRDKNPELIKILFSNSDKSKNLDWWENSAWPYPLLSKLKDKISVLKDKEKYQDMLARFDEMDGIKKDICQLSSVQKLQDTLTKFPGMEIILKNPSLDLLSCAINSNNTALTMHLLENNLFSPSNLPKLVTQLNKGAVTGDNLLFLTSLEKKMDELKMPHPDKSSQQTLWVLDHLADEVKCFQKDGSELLEVKSFAELTQRIVFSAIVKEMEKLKDAKTKASAFDNIVEIITQSGMPLNYQDQDGKTIMHHLAAFADNFLIDKFEKTLNTNRLMMNYDLQDKQGNTPLHIALINKNMKGGLTLADEIYQLQHGFGYGVRKDVTTKNLEGKTPLDIAKELKVAKADKDTLKTIKKWIKEHIKPTGRFDEEDD